MTDENSIKKQMQNIAKNGLLLFVGGVVISIPRTIDTIYTNGKKYYTPTNAHTEYINNDSLPDLVYKTGEIFLQTKEGNFVSYENMLNKEKLKIDSLYQVKQDSLKKVYGSNLENEVK